MKKILSLLFTTVLFISCEQPEEQKEVKVKSKTTVTIQYYDLDNCEYIGRLKDDNKDFLAHSGQCVYCVKRHEKLMDSLIKKNLYEFFAMSKDSTRVP